MAGAILGIWGISTLWDIWSTKYSPPDGQNTIALAAVTFFLGRAFLKERR